MSTPSTYFTTPAVARSPVIAQRLHRRVSRGRRFPFLAVAVPGLTLNLLLALIAKEPRRGQHEAGLQELFAAGHDYNERIRLADLPQLLLLFWVFPAEEAALQQSLRRLAKRAARD